MPAAPSLNPLTELKNYFIVFFSCVLLFPSCKKGQIELLTQEIQTGTTLQLHDILFVNDSLGYVCGGEKWAKGIFMRSTNGGKTWSSPDSIFNACAYSLQFFSENDGVVAGNGSNWSSTTDSGKTFIVSQTDYQPINDIALRDGNTWIKVGGDAYADGYISSTHDAGNTWNKTTLPNNMTAVALADSNTVFASGYGVIYKSTDAGSSFHPLNVRGDFFMAMDFPTSQVGYFAGWEGLILKTSDAGNSFQKVLNGNGAFSSRVHFEAIKFWNVSIGYAAGDNGAMYKTNNGGDNWKKIIPFTDVNLRAIHLFSGSSGIVCGDKGKIFLFRE